MQTVFTTVLISTIQAQLDQQDRQDQKVIQDRLDQQVLLGQVVHQELVGIKVQRVQLVQLEILELEVIQEQQAVPVNRDQLDLQVPLD